MGIGIADFGFKPTYDNYRQRHTLYNNESASTSFNGLTEDQWKALTPEQQLQEFVSGDADPNSMGGGLSATNGLVGPDHYSEIRSAMQLPDNYAGPLSVSYIPHADTGGASGLGPVFDPTAHPYSLGGDYYASTPGMLSQSRKDAIHGNRWEFLRNAALIAAAVLGGGAAAGEFGAGAGGAAGAAEGGGYGSMTGVAGDESAGLLGTGSYAGEGAGYGSMTGAAGNESAGLLGADGTMGGSGAGGGSSGLLGGSGNGLPEVVDHSVVANQPSWWQQAGSNFLNNPQNWVRTGMGLYSMAQGMGNHNQTAGSPQYAGGGVAQGVPQLNIGGGPGGQSQFQMNPYLMAAMSQVPFMSREPFYGGSNGLLGQF